MENNRMDAQRAAAGHLIKAPARKYFEEHGWFDGTFVSFQKRRCVYRCVLGLGTLLSARQALQRRRPLAHERIERGLSMCALCTCAHCSHTPSLTFFNTYCCQTRCCGSS